LQKVAQMHREEVKEIKAEVAALRDEAAKNAERVNEAKRNNDAIKQRAAAKPSASPSSRTRATTVQPRRRHSASAPPMLKLS
jgi:chromosome segregation ATPase